MFTGLRLGMRFKKRCTTNQLESFKVVLYLLNARARASQVYIAVKGTKEVSVFSDTVETTNQRPVSKRWIRFEVNRVTAVLSMIFSTRWAVTSSVWGRNPLLSFMITCVVAPEGAG